MTKAQILNHIPTATEKGYVLKLIKDIDKPAIATVNGNQIDLKTTGKFTATIVLAHPNYFDVTLRKCEFDIVAPYFSFNKYTHNRGSGNTVTTAQIENNIPLAKSEGYSLKTIKDISNVTVAEVDGTGRNITIKTVGKLTATLVLMHPNSADRILRNCEFQIIGLPAPTLTFDKLTRNLGGGKTFSKAQIWSKIQGTKTGYQLKSITLNDDDFGDVNGTKPDLKIDLKKGGTFKAKIVLKRAGYADAVVYPCEFEVTLPALSLKGFAQFDDTGTNNTANESDILAKIDGLPAGYTLETFTPKDASYVNITKSPFKLEFLKLGKFNADIVLKHTNYFDIKLDNIAFEYRKIVFGKEYGEVGSEDFAQDMVETSNEDIVVVGHTTSKGAGGQDVWLLKLDKDGVVKTGGSGVNELDKTFGGGW